MAIKITAMTAKIMILGAFMGTSLKMKFPTAAKGDGSPHFNEGGFRGAVSWGWRAGGVAPYFAALTVLRLTAFS